MTMQWLYVSIKDHTRKLCCSKAAGVSSPSAKGKCLLGPKRDKMFLDGGRGALPKVLEACMGEVAWPIKPTRGQTASPPWAMAQRGGIVAYG